MRDDWGEWEVVRRQVAMCGRMSPTLVETVEVRATGAHSTTTGSIRPDGIYFCLDLPPGDYRVTATDGLGKVYGGGTARVSSSTAGDVTFGVVDIEAPSSVPSPPRSHRRRHSR